MKGIDREWGHCRKGVDDRVPAPTAPAAVAHVDRSAPSPRAGPMNRLSIAAAGVLAPGAAALRAGTQLSITESGW
jgi:hypothetical protein